MMNHARLMVGIEGLAIADRAYQQALGYARDRKQGRRPDQGAEESAPIIDHPDVRRMLMTMKATVEAMRGVTLSAGIAYDLAKHHPDKEARAVNQGLVDLLTPVVKGWCTDMGVEIASLGVQVHGGMGFIEETGAAQHYRDARIAPIYEGTNGIQALDLVGRKLTNMGGKPVDDYIAAIRETCAALRGATDPDAHLGTIETALGAGVDALESASGWLRTAMARGRRAIFGCSAWSRAATCWRKARWRRSVPWTAAATTPGFIATRFSPPGSSRSNCCRKPPRCWVRSPRARQRSTQSKPN
jgi:3-(methylthio)propanoyl-CoA dehydrogenase